MRLCVVNIYMVIIIHPTLRLPSGVGRRCSAAVGKAVRPAQRCDSPEVNPGISGHDQQVLGLKPRAQCRDSRVCGRGFIKEAWELDVLSVDVPIQPAADPYLSFRLSRSWSVRWNLTCCLSGFLGEGRSSTACH